jgi:hypothetical protein
MLEPSFPGDHSGLAPPDSISNSVVKRTRAYDSVVFHHVKVGHRQGFIPKAVNLNKINCFFYGKNKSFGIKYQLQFFILSI